MANVTLKGKMTTGRRDLLKVPYTQEELKQYEKGLMRYNNTSLTREEFECHYHTSPTVARLLNNMKNDTINPKSLDEYLAMVSAGLMFGLGTGIEYLSLKGYPLDKQATIKWESSILNKVWERIFNPNKTTNTVVNGVPRYIWLEEVSKPLLTCDTICNGSEMGLLISELRGLLDIFIKEQLTEVVTSLTGMLASLERLLKEFLFYHINMVEKNTLNKPGFFQKFWNTICEYKWWIAAYAGVAAIVYFGIAAFSIPVAGEIWTMGNAAAATAVETVAVTASMGVAGAILL